MVPQIAVRVAAAALLAVGAMQLLGADLVADTAGAAFLACAGLAAAGVARPAAAARDALVALAVAAAARRWGAEVTAANVCALAAIFLDRI